jgi:carboxyl-terminal processing protease
MSFKVRTLLVVVVGVVLGVTVSLGNGLLVARQSRAATASVSSDADLARIAEVLARVREEYVDRVDDAKLAEAAIRGILGELGDEHSRYLDPREYEEIRISTTGNYSGVGLDVSVDGGQLKVVAPLDGAPAYQAGILPGDVLVSVDDVPVSGGDVEDTISRMRGEPGTPVTLGVLRGAAESPLRFALTRAEIQVKTVHSEYLGQGYGYVRLSGFSDTTAGDVAVAISDLKRAAQGELRGTVLDLRNNPGGVLDSAVDVADAFLDRGLIVRGTGRVPEARFARYARSGDLLAGGPLTVLVNAGSASASEIVAGALQDHGRARILGERTYGKGSVQTVMPLGGGSAIKLTTSRYLTPSGRSINGRGVDPDVVVVADDAGRRYRGPGSRYPASGDKQLQEALRLMGYSAVKLSSAP